MGGDRFNFTQKIVDAEVLNRLSNFGITQEKLVAGKAEVDALLSLNSAQEQEKVDALLSLNSAQEQEKGETTPTATKNAPAISSANSSIYTQKQSNKK